MRPIHSQRERGNTLMLTLFFCLAIGMVLASVLKLIGGRYAMTVRSTDWNECIPVLEAGIEEAMTHIHDDNSSSANGWTATTVSGKLVYQKQRSFSDGSYFFTTIYNASSNSPSIVSQGFVRVPMKANKYIGRTVLVSLTNPPNVFTKALATVSSISMVGVDTVDSYNSTKGPYNTTSNRNANGSIATDSTNTPAITLGNATISGNVTTGPGGTVSGGNITGGTNNNMNVSFPSNPPPAGPFGVLVESSSNVWNVASGSYKMSSYNGDTINVTGNVSLWVDSSFSISGGGSIKINNGATLTLYVSGNVDIGGNGVANNPGLPADFSLVGLSGCTSITYHGNPDLYGTIYAPQATFSMKGTAVMYGAVIANAASFNGNVALHYDESLATLGGLVATSWIEQ